MIERLGNVLYWMGNIFAALLEWLSSLSEPITRQMGRVPRTSMPDRPKRLDPVADRAGFQIRLGGRALNFNLGKSACVRAQVEESNHADRDWAGAFECM
jgi:hypothetical protein